MYIPGCWVPIESKLNQAIMSNEPSASSTEGDAPTVDPEKLKQNKAQAVPRWFRSRSLFSHHLDFLSLNLSRFKRSASRTEERSEFQGLAVVEP